MALRHTVPGLVWCAVGIGIAVWAETTDTPLVIRGTGINFGWAVIAAGVVLAVLGLVRNRRQL